MKRIFKLELFLRGYPKQLIIFHLDKDQAGESVFIVLLHSYVFLLNVP